METVLNIIDDIDINADRTVQNCFDLDNPRSFFLFAGAGSGKTRSLVSALEFISSNIGYDLRLRYRKVAVITYTNAARDEISHRVQYNDLFEISTIHSFAWKLICHHTSDICKWLKEYLNLKIADANNKLLTIRNRKSKTYINTEYKLNKYKLRFEHLDLVKAFKYNPDGVNTGYNSLDHSEVISITADLLTQNETLQKILIDSYPFLLIDESQDTKKELMNVLLQLQSKYSDRFMLGLFGDIMQRIYLDGKEDLGRSIPDTWETPFKTMNHRSQKRIVDLCNSIRKNTDGIKQRCRDDKMGGFVHVFVTKNGDETEKEQHVCMRMSDITGDVKWNDINNIKALTIEHKMAAKRLGFNSFYEALNNESSYRQGLADGSLSVIGILTRILVPLHKAYVNRDLFEITRVVKKYSLDYIEAKKDLTDDRLNELEVKIQKLLNCWDSNDPSCIMLLRIIYENKIFPLPDDIEQLIEAPPLENDKENNRMNCLARALSVPFSEVEYYWEYISGHARFGTHQGVKGLEFERVMAIIDDDSARGSTFNYNKLFGIQEKSDTDLKNEAEGKETTIDRTRRLFYVICSRAIDSLAIVYYSNEIDNAVEAIKSTGWFSDNEIETI